MAKDTGIVNIHGKEYKTVAARVNEFRAKFEQKYSLESEIVSVNGEMVIMKAFIRDIQVEGWPVIAVGHAEESRGASTINKTSALENCETSAYGRALAAFGFAGTEFASADEVANAIHQQKSAPKEVITKRSDTTNTAEPFGEDQDTVLARAKVAINAQLEAQGYTLPLQKTVFINKVLGKNTIDDLNDADAVADALDNERDSPINRGEQHE